LARRGLAADAVWRWGTLLIGLALLAASAASVPGQPITLDSPGQNQTVCYGESVPFSATINYSIRPITNRGTADLTGLAITKDGSHPADFTVTALGATTLAPGASTTFTVTFSPTAVGSRNAALHLASNDGDENPFDITLTGKALETVSGWIAFIDHMRGPDTSDYVTVVDLKADSGAKLTNFLSGQALPVGFAISRSGDSEDAVPMGEPNPDTPAYRTFHGIVDFTNASVNGVALHPSAVYTLAFSNLDPAKRYSFKGTAVRGGGYTTRWTVCAIVGADDFLEAHTAGCLTNGHPDVPAGTIPLGQVAFNSGRNLAGDMVDWEQIDPGSDGQFSVEMRQWVGAIPGGGTAGGPYGYALNAVRLEEYPLQRVYLASPADGAVFTEPANITIEATAFPAAEVSKVEFYRGATKIGEDLASPYSLTWSGVSPGTYQLTAVAVFAGEQRMSSLPSIITVAPSSARVIRGPYLNSRGATSIVVRWRTDVQTYGRVCFGPNQAHLDNCAEEAILTANHSVTLTGLQPETGYYYSIGTPAGPLLAGPDFRFTTAPPVGESRPTRIWFLSDFGFGNTTQREVRDAYLNYVSTSDRPADVWITGGDNDQLNPGGTDANYQATVFDVYPTIFRNTPIFPSLGNHDINDVYSNATQTSAVILTNAYFSIFHMPTNGEAGGWPSSNQNYYSFDYGDIHFVALNGLSPDLRTNLPNSRMLQWLTNDLARTRQLWIIAYWHGPPYTKGSYDSDRFTPTDIYNSFGAMIDMRTNAVPILESYGVDLVLCGHSHVYERTYLIKNHYGYSWDFGATNIVDAGDGRPDGPDGPYRKSSVREPRDGTVYVTAGVGGLPYDDYTDKHLAHKVDLGAVAGSCLIDVTPAAPGSADSRLDFTFLRSGGAKPDYFTIVKGPPLVGTGVEPIITQQPEDATVPVGAAASFSVTAEGTGPLEYQWYFGDALVGETNATLTLQDVQPNDAGFYWAEVTSSEGRTNSRVLMLTVLVPPNIVEQPVHQKVSARCSAVFSVIAEGTAPLSYQWWFNQTSRLDGETDSTLTLTEVQPAQAGGYQVVVSNAYGSVTSSVAMLMVTSADSDCDGMPDDWELYFKLDPYDPTDAGLDGDGDSLTNLQEYLAGTNPANDTGKPGLEIYLTAEREVVVRWLSVPAIGPGYDGKTRYYDLLSRTNVASGDWLGVPGLTNLPAVVSDWLSHTNASSDLERFYRLRVRLE
jgi:hypothetical protein